MSKKLTQAVQFARAAHKGQKRASGEDFIEHPLLLVEMLKKEDVPEKILMVAVLHDVVEDAGIPAQDLLDIFGTLVGASVCFLSKDYYPSKSMRIEKYIEKLIKGVEFNECVYLVKLADVLHNTKTLTYFSREKQVQQIYEVEEFFIPFFVEHLPIVSSKYHSFCLKAIREILEICIASKISFQEKLQYVV